MESKVEVLESSLVAPSEAAPTKVLWLSPFDLALANRGHTPLVYFYSSGAAFVDIARLKEGIAKALAAFYPFAGRLGVSDDGRAQISCNGEGALFVVARSCIKSNDLDFSKPSPELRRLFVPRVEPSSLTLAVQEWPSTTPLWTGRARSTSCRHAWSAFSRDGDGAAVEVPCHDRTLLRARSPPVVHPDALSVLCPKVTFSETSGPTATEVFTISRDQLATLERLCGGASTFCSVSALVWLCTSVVRRLPPDAETRLSFPANVRRRVRPPLPDRYFGNALVLLGATAAARDVTSESLASVAGRISGAVARMDDELVRSAIDHLELAGMDSRPLRGSMPETELRVISWLGMPVYNADFGCGSPQVMSRAESGRGGFVYLVNDGPAGHRGGGAVRVVMCMEAANMKKLERLLYANIATASKL
ncbi:Shikimate O-hydroxycinnamoyltransferase [Dichanthelium oligosanthes]|uniref:Shikimate O-hydroxycinnamoyltransferase n=1 Tax=Dichanthelium oligosanthes TaxID=888268 RepID=A0A1E5WLV7_9POAL|nr:Shikimate O-hydroxycinnamoyltransferase [Dichanthelium oligosanthes]